MTYFSSTLLLFLWDPSFYFQVSFIPRQSLSESSGITKRVRSAGGNKTVRSFENTLSLSPFFLTHTATWNIIPIPFSHSLPYFITTNRCFHANSRWEKREENAVAAYLLFRLQYLISPALRETSFLFESPISPERKSASSIFGSLCRKQVIGAKTYLK